MNRRRGWRSIALLLGLILLALGYGSIVYYHFELTRISRLDGMIGVMLGLFISSRPAANLLDLLYQSASDRHPGNLWIWLMLNVLTLLTGVIVVIIGAIQFTRAAPGAPIL